MVNQRGDLKISDFGIARSLGDSALSWSRKLSTAARVRSHRLRANKNGANFYVTRMLRKDHQAKRASITTL